MENTISDSKSIKRTRKKKRRKPREQAVLSVISVRLSDDEKDRIDEIMRSGDFKCYSDMVRMAIHMYRVPNIGDYVRSDKYH